MTNPNSKTAIVVGATGLVGSHLLNKLLKDQRYIKIKVFTRRTTGITHPKLEEEIIDFNLIEKWGVKITGDELFSSLGTTLKQAGSKEKQYLVDYTYQYEVAKAAAENHVSKYILVSSAGSHRFSPNFYLRMKGILDYEVSQMPFEKIVIFQPSALVGKREKPRFFEKSSIKMINVITRIVPLFKKYRPIKAETVADAMINAANDSSFEKLLIYKSDQINLIAG